MRPKVTKTTSFAEDLAAPKKFFKNIGGYSETPTIDLLTALLIGEAESRPVDEMRAVAQVVANRAFDERQRYGNDWRSVMLKPKQFQGLSRQDARKRIKENFSRGSDALWNARGVAYEALSGRLEVPDFVLRATHFDSGTSVHPDLKEIGRIGSFKFYLEK